MNAFLGEGWSFQKLKTLPTSVTTKQPISEKTGIHGVCLGAHVCTNPRAPVPDSENLRAQRLSVNHKLAGQGKGPQGTPKGHLHTHQPTTVPLSLTCAKPSRLRKHPRSERDESHLSPWYTCLWASPPAPRIRT